MNRILLKPIDMSDNEYNIITHLTQIRQNNKLTQKDLAKMCDTSQEVLSRFESGTNSPSLRNVCKIADALGFDLVLISKKETT